VLGTQTIRVVRITYRDIDEVISRHQLQGTELSTLHTCMLQSMMQFDVKTNPPHPHVESWTSFDRRLTHF